jgi:hypothetical protein
MAGYIIAYSRIPVVYNWLCACINLSIPGRMSSCRDGWVHHRLLQDSGCLLVSAHALTGVYLVEGVAVEMAGYITAYSMIAVVYLFLRMR